MAGWETRGQRPEAGLPNFSFSAFQRFSFCLRRSDFPISRFHLSAFALASQLWSGDFTAKLFCNVEFWLERLPKMVDGSGVSNSQVS